MNITTKTTTSVYLDLNEVNTALVEYLNSQTLGEGFPTDSENIGVEMQIRHRTDRNGLPRPEVLGAVITLEE